VCIHRGPTFFNLLLNPVPIQTASSVYKYGTGHALLFIRGDTVSLRAELRNAEPLTQYSITLDINGTSHQLATMVTDQNGNGMVAAQILLHNGRYAISVQVFDTTNFPSPTLVLQSDSVSVITPAPVGPTAVGLQAPVDSNSQGR